MNKLKNLPIDRGSRDENERLFFFVFMMKESIEMSGEFHRFANDWETSLYPGRTIKLQPLILRLQAAFVIDTFYLFSSISIIIFTSAQLRSLSVFQLTSLFSLRTAETTLSFACASFFLYLYRCEVNRWKKESHGHHRRMNKMVWHVENVQMKVSSCQINFSFHIDSSPCICADTDWSLWLSDSLVHQLMNRFNSNGYAD